MKRSLSLGLALGLAALLASPTARAEAICEQQSLEDFAPADGMKGVPTDVVLRFLHTFGDCGSPNPDFSSPTIKLAQGMTPVEVILEPVRASTLYEATIPGGLLPDTEYSLSIGSFEQIFLETKFTTGSGGEEVSGPPKITIDQVTLDSNIQLGQGITNFVSLTFTPAPGNGNLVSVYHVMRVDEKGGNPSPFVQLGRRPSEPVQLMTSAKVIIGEKLCFQGIQEDGAGHLSEPSAVACGTAVGPETADDLHPDPDPQASSCGTAPRRASWSSPGFAAAALVAIAALARRRSRRSRVARR